MMSTLDQLDERIAAVAAQVAATTVVRLAEATPPAVLSAAGFDSIVSVAVSEAVRIMRAEMDALRSELLEAERVSVVDRDGQGNIVLVTTTTIPAT